MKYYKTLNLYKASNVEYDPETGIGLSYGWWQVVKPINGLTVFNAYNYSNTTIKHQYKIRKLLMNLGITIDLIIEAPQGLQDLGSAILFYQDKINKSWEVIKKPKTHKSKNRERIKQIESWRRIINQIKALREGEPNELKFA